MENLPKLVSERLKTAPPKTHPDPDLLAAFAEHSLKGQERTQVLEHLSTCADCREIVSLAQPLQEDVAAPLVKKSTWISFPILRWGTAAALVVIVGGALLLREQRRFAPAPTASKIQNETQSPAPPQSAAALYRADKDQVLRDRLEREVVAKKELKKPAETRNGMVTLSQSHVPGKPEVNDKKVSIARDLGPVSANVGASESGAQAAATAPAPIGKLDAENSQASERVPSTSQSVEVTAAAPMITTNEDEVSKAKEALPKVAKDSGLPPEAVHSIGARTAATNQAAGAYVFAMPSFPRWTISADGTLQRSIDSGKTWENVVVENQIFRAVATVGADVWAGGSAGLLYHSSDAGQQWTRIKPSAHGTSLTDDIARIEFTDHQHGKLTTTAGKAWSTSDAGQTWKKH